MSVLMVRDADGDSDMMMIYVCACVCVCVYTQIFRFLDKAINFNGEW